VDVCLLFEIRIEIPLRHCAQAARDNKTVIARLDRAIQYAAVSRLDTTVSGILGRPVKPGDDRDVIAGLDPAIHPLRKTLLKFDGYAGQARV
jgi:hypothetical protein